LARIFHEITRGAPLSGLLAASRLFDYYFQCSLTDDLVLICPETNLADSARRDLGCQMIAACDQRLFSIETRSMISMFFSLEVLS
jgi:hypothetical protein